MKTEKKDFKKSCTRSNILYKATCLACKEKREMGLTEDEIEKEGRKPDDEKEETLYIGESSKNMYKRSLQHISKITSIWKESFMVRHVVQEHPEIPIENAKDWLKFTVLEYHLKPMERMIAESTEIKRMKLLKNKTLLNMKMAYNRTIIPAELEKEAELDEKI